jgi:serine/threonine protein kinase
LKKLDHPNIVVLKDCVLDEDRTLSLIFELLETDLHKFIWNHRGFLPRATIKSFLLQCCKGLDHCHKQGIMHRDLKPANLLVSTNLTLKIADFGLARRVGGANPTQRVCTLWYKAPELLLGAADYGLAVDMWSLGCIFGQMITKVPLFCGLSEIEQLFHIFQQLGTPNEANWPGVYMLVDWNSSFPTFQGRSFDPEITKEQKDLLERLFRYDPKERITVRDALQHPYLNDSGGPKVRKADILRDVSNV